MNIETLTTFFALLSLAAVGGALCTGVVWIVSKRADGGAAIHAVRASLADAALWLAWVVAAVTTAGSLYYSLSAGYEPCELCWYQRICIYPMSVILLVAAIRKDRSVWRYVVPVSAIGLVIAAYHTQLQAFPEQTTFCSLNNPCTIRYVWEFGFVSLPFMAAAAFVFVIALTMLAGRTADVGDDDPTPDGDHR